MRAVAIRRLVVFGVCAFGVGCLYLVPSVARSPDRVSSQESNDQPISSPPATLKPAPVQSTGRAMPGNEETRSPSQQPRTSTAKQTGTSRSNTDVQHDSSSRRNANARDDTNSSKDDRSSGEEKTEGRQTAHGGATAFDPRQENDDTAPDPVHGIKFGPITPDDLTVRWSASNDDTAVVGYQIWLDGFRVATTTETRVTVNWFNDDMGQHVVQVKALDAAGNQSKATEIRLITRPTPEPSETPSSKPSPKPSATASPNQASEPTQSRPTREHLR